MYASQHLMAFKEMINIKFLNLNGIPENTHSGRKIWETSIRYLFTTIRIQNVQQYSTVYYDSYLDFGIDAKFITKL